MKTKNENKRVTLFFHCQKIDCPHYSKSSIQRKARPKKATPKMNTSFLIAHYEQKFIDMVKDTYVILKKLDEVKNDEEFWSVFEVIEKSYIEFEKAKDNYYNLLRSDGGTAHGCSLNYEFEYGVDFLEDKYYAIKDTVNEIRVFRT